MCVHAKILLTDTQQRMPAKLFVNNKIKDVFISVCQTAQSGLFGNISKGMKL